MSALRQKQTHAPQKAMSALTRIATAKADSRERSCPLYPRKQTCAVQSEMSAKGQKADIATLFDDLISGGEQARWDSDTKRLRCF